jgi:hypothetical protein
MCFNFYQTKPVLMYKYLILFCLVILVPDLFANDLMKSNEVPSIAYMKKRADAYWKSMGASVDYLPLSGGTLTGSLYGTSAVFSGAGQFGGQTTVSQGASVTSFISRGDWDAGATNNTQIYITGFSNINKQLRIGYETTNNYGYIQALISGTATSNLSINPSGGNVGVGTTFPSYKLEVVTPGTIGMRLQTSASTIGAPQIDLYDAARYQETVISSTDGLTTGTYIASYSSHPLMLGVNHGTAEVTLATNGNLGIGTKTPGYLPNGSASGSSAKLEVNGNIRINTLSTVASGEIGNLQFLKAHTATTATTYSTAEIRAFTASGYDGGLRMYTSQHVGGGKL